MSHRHEDETPELYVIALWLFAAMYVGAWVYEVLHG